MNDSASPAQLADHAERFGFSVAAVAHLWSAVVQGGGDMAMFDHPEFAGPGQWMRGGLIMITEPANQVLKNRIDALCNALSRLFREQAADRRHEPWRINPNARGWDTVVPAHERWWPADLGEPAARGENASLAYAYFDGPARLAIRRAGRVTLYATGAHHITGVAQAQTAETGEIVFTSQIGEVVLADLACIADHDAGDSAPAARAGATGSPHDAILDALERLGELKRQGVLSEAEFAAKKQELLARL
ncbi:hypothetical protein T5B8_12633 [Salinisphaera sp. T5B8]|uniref:SHOCT domain-containing protein n=1 Tax=unclassified Salinisphaera TaxID=2649847 RepID=UPI00333EAC59